MDFIFNELSFEDRASDIHSGRLKMQNLLQVCKLGREAGMSRLAIRYDFYEQPLVDGYTATDWLNDSTVSSIFKNLFQSIVRHPYIDGNDSSIEDRFISSYAHLYEDQETNVEGIAVAYLYNTLAISFYSSEKWNSHEIVLKFSELNFDTQIVKAKHASVTSHIAFHQNWIRERVGVNLLISEVTSDQKKIRLRDDHGKDILLALSRKLVRSQYVVEIINSLPFNSKENNFVRKYYNDGKIEIVLCRLDEGFGLVIQTTGRSLAETKAIAGILEEEFSSEY